MKVLIIDDNESITKMLAKWLSSKNHECTVSNDGKNGLEMIRKNKFDKILLDLSMPEFSGFDVVDKLDSDGILNEQHIILFTASATSDTDIEKLISKGVKGCLRKPVDLNLLLKTVES